MFTLSSSLSQIRGVIDNGANDTRAIERALQSMQTATATGTLVTGDIKAATEALNDLAHARVAVECATVSDAEIMVGLHQYVNDKCRVRLHIFLRYMLIPQDL